MVVCSYLAPPLETNNPQKMSEALMTSIPETWSLASAKRLDELCDHFEAHWCGSVSLEMIARAVERAEDDQRPTVLEALLDIELELRRKAGEVPDVSVYKGRFPQYHEVIERAMNGSYDSLKQSHSNPQEFDVELNPSESFGRFKIIERVGKGAFGVVYRAHDPELGRDVAIKIPRHRSSEDQERFLREGRAASTLRQQNICPIYEVGQHNTIPYLVLAFIEGETLADYLKRMQKLPLHTALEMVRQVAVAIGYAHELGVIHRDLKPSNIMIDSSGEPVVMDFGLARRINGDEATLAGHGAVFGSPGYMSPEQARGEPVGVQTDIYSLGVVLYLVLAGQAPYSTKFGEFFSQLLGGDVPQPPSKYRDGLSDSIDDVCRIAMAKDPVERYSTMNDFAKAIQQAVPTAEDSRVAHSDERQWHTMKPAIVTLGVFALAIAALAVFWEPKGEPTSVPGQIGERTGLGQISPLAVPEQLDSSEAADWMRRALANYTPQRFIEATLADETSVEREGSTSTIKLLISTKVKEDAYKPVQDQIVSVLEATTLGTKLATREIETLDVRSRLGFYKLGDIDNESRQHLFGKEDYRYWAFVTSVRDESNIDQFKTRWKAYEIPPSLRAVFDEQYEIRYRIRIAVVSATGEILSEQTKPLRASTSWHSLDALSQSNWKTVRFHLGPALWAGGYYVTKISPIPVAIPVESEAIESGFKIDLKIEEDKR